jgi:RNA polymerase sigma factor (sigma-70 family)
MSSANETVRRKPARDSFNNVQETVNAVVRRLVGTRDPEYEDLVQTTLLSVLGTLDGGRFRGDCPPVGWAAIIARNVAVDAIRARVRERRVFKADACDEDVGDPSNVTDAGLGPERLTELRRTLDRVNHALAGLGPHKARVVYLHDVLGYQLAEVAAIVGTSKAAAQSRLVRGRREIVETMPSAAAAPRAELKATRRRESK